MGTTTAQFMFGNLDIRRAKVRKTAG